MLACVRDSKRDLEQPSIGISVIMQIYSVGYYVEYD